MVAQGEMGVIRIFLLFPVDMLRITLTAQEYLTARPPETPSLEATRAKTLQACKPLSIQLGPIILDSFSLCHIIFRFLYVSHNNSPLMMCRHTPLFIFSRGFIFTKFAPPPPWDAVLQKRMFRALL